MPSSVAPKPPSARALAEREVAAATEYLKRCSSMAGAPPTTATTAEREFAEERAHEAAGVLELVRARPLPSQAVPFIKARERLTSERERFSNEETVARERAALAMAAGALGGATVEDARRAFMAAEGATLAAALEEAEAAWRAEHPDERERTAAEAEAQRLIRTEREAEVRAERERAVQRSQAAAAGLEQAKRQREQEAEQARKLAQAAKNPDEQELAELKLTAATLATARDELRAKALEAEAAACEAEAQLELALTRNAQELPALLLLEPGVKRVSDASTAWTSQAQVLKANLAALDHERDLLRNRTPGLRTQANDWAARSEALGEARVPPRQEELHRQKVAAARQVYRRAASQLDEHRTRLESLERRREAMARQLEAAEAAVARLRDHADWRFLGQTEAQWWGFGMVLLLTVIVSWLVHRPVRSLLKRVAGATRWTLDDIVLEEFDLPARLVVALLGLSAAFHEFTLDAELLAWLAMARAAAEVLLTGFVAWRVVNVLVRSLEPRVEKSANTLDDQLLRFGRRTLRAVIVFFTTVYLLDNLGWKISSLLAGLGIGGLAFALAAQDTLSNLFGSLVLFLDRPFKVGDWVKIGDAEGIVEDIGIRSTRVRTFKDTLITMPNAKVASASAENVHSFRRRRMDFELLLRHDTPVAKITAVMERLKLILDGEGLVDKDFGVNFSGITEMGLKLFVVCFMHTRDWPPFKETSQRIYLATLTMLAEEGVALAYPRRTLVMEGGAPSPRA